MGPASQFPQDLTRLRQQYFSSSDQLLTLALNAAVNADQWRLARSVGAPIVGHFFNADLQAVRNVLGPDVEYIHCTQLSEATWKLLADSGARVSIAPAIEMQMRHGMPPFQAALDHGIRPSLSVDVECNMTADMFSIMRAAFTLQRALVNQRALAGEKNLPRLLTSRDTLELATIEGARTAHLDSKIGTLTPGKEADIVLIDTNDIHLYPRHNAITTVVEGAHIGNVDTVFIAGEIRKWRGKLTSPLLGRNMDNIKQMVDESRDYLFAATKWPVGKIDFSD